MNAEENIKQLALDAGFDLCGIASLASPPAHLTHLNSWLERGLQGELGWMQRQAEKRLDPTRVLEGAKSMICVGLLYNTAHPYSTDPEAEGKAWVSRYAWGEDYHEVLGRKLKAFEDELKKLAPTARFLSYVDTGPISEKAWAAQAGLGWQGKHTNLINQAKGSWFFIGELLCDLELTPDQPVADLCGTCTRCLDACPTQAFTQAYELDAKRCLSYLSIEQKGDIPQEFQTAMGYNLYGCDICQDVCPWNRARITGNEAAFEPRPGLLLPDANELAQLSDTDFSARFKGSAMKRSKATGLRRNAAVVAKNLAAEKP